MSKMGTKPQRKNVMTGKNREKLLAKQSDKTFVFVTEELHF